MWEIGSNSGIAVYQELGTATIPPRPFLASSAEYWAKPIKDMTKELVGAAVASKSIAGEIAKIIAETAHEIKKSAEKPLERARSPNPLLFNAFFVD